MEDRILSILSAYVYPPQLSAFNAGEGLLTELKINPFDLAYTLPLRLEEVFDIEEIPGTEIDSWETVDDIVRSVQKLTKENAFV